MNYEYKCPDCAEIYVEERGINDDESIPICGPCNKITKRVWNSAPVIFTGSGFYTTDKRK